MKWGSGVSSLQACEHALKQKWNASFFISSHVSEKAVQQEVGGKKHTGSEERMVYLQTAVPVAFSVSFYVQKV